MSDNFKCFLIKSSRRTLLALPFTLLKGLKGKLSAGLSTCLMRASSQPIQPQRRTIDEKS